MQTEAGGGDIAEPLAPSGEQRTRALGGEEAAHHAHGEHHQRQQHQHLGRVVEEEFDRFGAMAAGLHRQPAHQPSGERRELGIDHEPERGRGDRCRRPDQSDAFRGGLRSVNDRSVLTPLSSSRKKPGN